jgi:hypothetical protein
MKIANRSFGNVEKLTLLGTSVTRQYLDCEEIKNSSILIMFVIIQLRKFCILVCCLET